MKKRLTYEAPLARDLSAFGASGQWPLYNCNPGAFAAPDPCTGGFSATTTCSAGITVGQPNPACTNGPNPLSGECLTGGTPSAGSQCLSGVAPNGHCGNGGTPT